MAPQSLQTAERIIETAPPRQQRQFLMRLPRLLKMAEADFGLLKLAETSFEFWDNPVDDLYNDL